MAGVAYPIANARYSFRHESAEHRVAYGGITLYEQLGPQNPTFTYTVVMDQGLARGEYSGMLTKVPDLMASMYDRTPREIEDPLYGKWTVVPVDYQSELDAQKRSGAMVTVSFAWAPEIDQDVPRDGGVASVQGLVDDANALDEEITRIARVYDRAANPPQINPLDLAASVTGQLSRNVDRMNAQLSNLASRAEKTERYANTLITQFRDPDAIGAHRSARRLRSSATRMQKQINAAARDVGQVTIDQAKNVVSVAAEFGMSVKELLSLNVELARSPMVPAGTSVNVYKSEAA
jgi:hypothetical protein